MKGEGELELCLSSPKDGRGAGGEGKDLNKIGMLPLFCLFSPRNVQLLMIEIIIMSPLGHQFLVSPPLNQHASI
jgi:hypothetical protein